MVAYTYSKLPTVNFNTTPPSIARSATGSVYDVGDTGFTTPLNMTMVLGGAVVTTISSDALGFLPDFTLDGRVSCVWKQAGSSFATVLSTSDSIPGPPGPNTIPTDTAIKNVVNDPASQTAGALNATILTQTGGKADRQTPANVVALGDSQTAGTLTPGLAYPNIVAALVDRRLGIVNKGIGGNTTAQMLARVQADVIALAPKICIFMGGTNDISTSVPLADTQANIKAIADAVTAAGIEFVINTIPPRNQHGALGAGKVRDLNNWIRLWGAAKGYRVVDLNPLVVNPQNGEYAAGLSVDAVHPSAAAIMLMSQAVSQVLTASPRTSLVPSIAPTECEVDYLATSAIQSAQLVNNPLFYATISDSINYPNRPDTWASTGSAAVVTASSAGATTIQISDPLAPGSYVFSTGQVQAEARTITSVTGSASPYTATVSAAFSNPHPVAHYIDRAAAPMTLVNDSRFVGKAMKIVGNNMDSAHKNSVILPSSAWAVGNKIRLVAKVALDSPVSIPSGKGVEVSIDFAGAGTSVKAITQMNWASPTGLAMTFAADAVVPAGTTSVTVSASFDSGSGSGTAYFGQVGALNLTTLSVDTIALPA